ncbi:cyclic nucleotide-binding domain protein (macronuclear) [Tetrahymena thermophila SB210]|uniref:Cyclic nucleotide-binding domain protein n=1 Tax=Tetrahymena thermophila (strain SB210) TaxID=312017 RepID=Q23CM8_TETTS|nr:cyclic nucleotide-binding domain protein [Tetrahymena thermophila SB210]EAR94252.3 cyclic nucleotide-binding domain protein [Tetrahymena thermophila SB210]|eukprot:XP_001014497.3 cyclic nucleotide-binding domain protein [Tetrahymena thermophila SB210]
MKYMIDLLRLVFIIGCVCHVFCLFWYGIAVYEMNLGKNNTWLHAKGLVEEDNILIKYIYSFYFLSVTMSTVGYGDITPQNPAEMTFTIITMFVTGFFWAYSLNRIGKIIQNSEKEDKAYRENMQIIHTFMREENVDSDLRAKVSNYLKYYYKESNEVKKNQEQIIINQLSDQLKNDLMKNVRGKYLKDIPFISQLKTQNKLISIMKEMLFSPGEYIFHQDEVNDCSLFFLVKGEVEIIQETSQKKQEGQILVKKLQKSSYFGEIAFITGGSRSSSARAIDFCVVYKMERLKFLEIVKESNDDYETFCMIKEALLFKSSYNLIQSKCFSCGDKSHLIQECNKIHFTVSKRLIAAKAFRSVAIKQRYPIQRRNKKYSALNNIDYCLNDAYKILNDQIFSESLESSYIDEQTMEQLQRLKTNQKYSFLSNKKVQTFLEDRKISINTSDLLAAPQIQTMYFEQNQKQQHDESSHNDQYTGSQGGSIFNQSEKEKPSNHNSQLKQKSPISSDNLESFTAAADENPTILFKSSQDIQKPQHQQEIQQKQQQQQVDCDHSELQKIIGQNNKVLNTDDVVLIDVNQLNDSKPQIITQKQQSNMKQYSKNLTGCQSNRQAIKRITFKKDELPKKNSIASEDLIPSSELIQPIYVQNSNFASIKNFKTNTIEDSDIQETSDTDTNNFKIKAQRYFQQIKCQNMVQKQQKCSFSQYQNTSSSSQKKIPLPDQYIQIQSQFNILEDYSRQSNQILESTDKSNNQDHFRKQLFEQQISKYPTIDQQKYKRPERRKSTITQETNFQSFYPNQKNLEQFVIRSQVFENQYFERIQQKQLKYSPEIYEQKQSKILDFIQQFEWEFLEMQLFDKIKNFQYYYPTFNFNNVIKKIKQQQQPRRTIHSKRKIRACLINGQRRKPIFDKNGLGNQNIFQNN